MIDFIIGDIVDIEEDHVLIENNGIGYKVFTSANTIFNLEVGLKSQVLYTQLFVREDGVFLYGFISKDEIEMFKLLLRVTKIGPKIGIGILSTLKPNQIKLAIMNKDVQSLTKAPGIGKKTAERMILELKDRIDSSSLIDLGEDFEIENGDYHEAIEGLMTLGYSKFEVERVISSLDINTMSVEDIIRKALKKLSSR